MNRQQRRMTQKKGLPVAHEPVFNMKQSDIKKIKQEASEKAVNTAMILLLGIPVKVLKEQYGWGMKKRLPEFCEAMIDVYTDFSNGDLTLEQFADLIYQECGVKFVNNETTVKVILTQLHTMEQRKLSGKNLNRKEESDT